MQYHHVQYTLSPIEFEPIIDKVFQKYHNYFHIPFQRLNSKRDRLLYYLEMTKSQMEDDFNEDFMNLQERKEHLKRSVENNEDFINEVGLEELQKDNVLMDYLKDEITLWFVHQVTPIGLTIENEKLNQQLEQFASGIVFNDQIHNRKDLMRIVYTMYGLGFFKNHDGTEIRLKDVMKKFSQFLNIDLMDYEDFLPVSSNRKPTVKEVQVFEKMKMEMWREYLK